MSLKLYDGFSVHDNAELLCWIYASVYRVGNLSEVSVKKEYCTADSGCEMYMNVEGCCFRKSQKKAEITSFYRYC